MFRAHWATALVVTALVVYASLYPWHIDFGRTHANPASVLLHSWPRGLNRFIIRDAVLNVLFYVPVGLVFFLALSRHCSTAMAFAAAALSATFLSVNIEMLQVYAQSRTCSLLDVVTNTTGGVAGALAGKLYRKKLRETSAEHPAKRHADALVLLVCWAGYQVYPLVPLLSRTRLRAGLAYLMQSPIRPTEVWASAAEWLAAGLALEFVDTELPRIWVAVPVACMLIRIILPGRTLTLDEVLGGGLALLLLFGLRPGRRPKAGLWLLASAIVVRELAPFRFSGQAEKFSWIPFMSSMEGERQAAALVFMRKAFDYGAVVWLVRRRGTPYVYSGAGIAIVLFACEWAQRYLPGRSPEITDSVLAILMAASLRLAERQSARKAAW